MVGLDPKYLEPSNPAAVPVHGLLRADYQRTVSSEPTVKLGATEDKYVFKQVLI